MDDGRNKKYWKYFVFGRNVLNDFATQISIKMILQNIIMVLFTFKTTWTLHLFKPERLTTRTNFGRFFMPCSFNFTP